MVDGSEIPRSPADMVSIHIIYHFRWWSLDFWSINSTSLGFLLWLFGIQKRNTCKKPRSLGVFFFFEDVQFFGSHGWCSFQASTVDWRAKLATRWRMHGYFCFALLVIREVFNSHESICGTIGSLDLRTKSRNLPSKINHSRRQIYQIWWILSAMDLPNIPLL